MVNISAVRNEEETTRNTRKAPLSVTIVRIKFSLAIGCDDAIQEFPAVNSRQILERAEWVDGDSVAITFPGIFSIPNTKGYHIALDGISYPLDPLWH